MYTYSTAVGKGGGDGFGPRGKSTSVHVTCNETKSLETQSLYEDKTMPKTLTRAIP